MERLALWLRLTRAGYTPPLLATVALGALYAVYDGHPFRPGAFVLCVLGSFFAHLAANAANDVFDHLSGADAAAETTESRDFGGSGVLTSGLATVGEAVAVALLALGLAFVFGLAVALVSGPGVLGIAAVGLVLGVLYSAPPLALSHLGRGLGEAAVFLAFGPVPVAGAYYAQTGRFDAGALFVSVPAGLLVTAILYNHHFTHPAGDAAVGKLSPVVVLGERRALRGSWALPALAYLAVLWNVRQEDYPGWSVLALATAIPMALELVRLRETNSPETYMRLTKRTAQIATFAILLLALGFVLDRISAPR